MKKAKAKEFNVEHAKFQFVPYSDGDGIGYIRIEKNGNYLYAFDGRRKNRRFLTHLKSVIDEWLRLQERSKG